MHGERIERELGRIADRTNDTGPFVDQIAAFSLIQGTEVTVLPVVPLIASRTHRFVPGTGIETFSNEDILAGKLVHRLCGAGVAEPRDLYDLVAAERYGPNAQRQAVDLLTDTQLNEISATLLMLPDNWASPSGASRASATCAGHSMDLFQRRSQVFRRILVRTARKGPQRLPMRTLPRVRQRNRATGLRHDYATSKRSRFITLSQAATKSFTNCGPESALP